MDSTGFKKCNKCLLTLPIDYFHKRSTAKVGLKSRCKNCRSEDAKIHYQNNKERELERTHNWRINNPDKVKEQTKKYRAKNKEKFRSWRLKAEYGITQVEWEDIFKNQGQSCAICGGEKSNSNGFVTDHDHVTGKVRGILCDDCNRGLGDFKDDPIRLIAAVNYLISPNSRAV